MTPFDSVALLAMLLAFYPIVSVAALQRARQERPEYFAAGVLESTSGEKLRLPDRRLFDLIFDVENVTGQRRWQVSLIDESGAGDADPFALEAGPLTPIDVARFAPRLVAPAFTPLAGAAAAELAGVGLVLDRAHGQLLELPAPATLEGAFRGVDDAAAAVPGLAAELDLATPAELFGALRAGTAEAARRRADLAVTRPADMQVIAWPGSPPPDRSGGGSTGGGAGGTTSASDSQRPDSSRV